MNAITTPKVSKTAVRQAMRFCYHFTYRKINQYYYDQLQNIWLSVNGNSATPWHRRSEAEQQAALQEAERLICLDKPETISI